MIPWLREPSLLCKLKKELAKTKEARITARAQAAYWINREEFLQQELVRLTEEIETLHLFDEEVPPMQPVVLTDSVEFHELSSR